LEFEKTTEKEEMVAAEIVDGAYSVHKELKELFYNLKLTALWAITHITALLTVR